MATRHPTRPSPPNDLRVWTIGHSRHPWERFLELLKAHEIALVADVRSIPQSRFVPHANRDRLQAALAAANLRYEWLGEGLGGRPKGDEFYDAEGQVRYDRIAASPQFQEQVQRLLSLLATQRVALLCSEEDPRNCHRRNHLTPVLIARGVTVEHLRGDGTVTSEADLRMQESRHSTRRQGTLFPDT